MGQDIGLYIFSITLKICQNDPCAGVGLVLKIETFPGEESVTEGLQHIVTAKGTPFTLYR